MHKIFSYAKQDCELKPNSQEPKVYYQEANKKKVQQQKQQLYKDQIMQLINENENLKLKYKQMVIANTSLETQLSEFSCSTNKKVLSDTEKKDKKQQIGAQSLIYKYQSIIQNLLEQYGCNKLQSRIDHIKCEIHIIDFLIDKFYSKAEDLRKYQQVTREKFENQQIQTSRIKETIKSINEMREIQQQKQLKSKQKIEQLKKEISLLNENLKSKDKQYEMLQSEYYYTKKLKSSTEVENEKNQSKRRQQHNYLKEMINHIKAENQQILSKYSELQSRYHSLLTAYQQLENVNQEFRRRNQVQQQEIERCNRETIRWKERYQWLEKQRFENLKKMQVDYANQKYKEKKEQFQKYENVIPEYKFNPFQNQIKEINKKSSFSSYSVNKRSTTEYDQSEQAKNQILERRIKMVEQQLLGNGINSTLQLLNDNKQSPQM